MNQRKIHQILGLVLLLPLLGWAVTGSVFLVKPGYEAAYEQLSVKTYPIDTEVNLIAEPDWQGIRIVRTVLGLHYLVNLDGKYEHYDVETLLPAEPPTAIQVRTLIADAIRAKSSRYGEIEAIHGLKTATSTGVEIQLNWNQLTLSQIGPDRRFIDTLYKVHYLQWTPWREVNLVLGVAGLLCLATITYFGLSIYLASRRDKV